MNYSTILLIIHVNQSQPRICALSSEGKGCAAVDEHLSMAARPLAFILWENQQAHQWEWEREPDIEP